MENPCFPVSARPRIGPCWREAKREGPRQGRRSRDSREGGARCEGGDLGSCAPARSCFRREAASTGSDTSRTTASRIAHGRAWRNWPHGGGRTSSTDGACDRGQDAGGRGGHGGPAKSNGGSAHKEVGGAVARCCVVVLARGPFPRRLRVLRNQRQDRAARQRLDGCLQLGVGAVDRKPPQFRVSRSINHAKKGSYRRAHGVSLLLFLAQATGWLPDKSLRRWPLPSAAPLRILVGLTTDSSERRSAG